jgi:hypothetical protein
MWVVIFWLFIKFFIWIERKCLKHPVEPTLGSAEKPQQNPNFLVSKFNSVMKYLREAIYHPWATLTETDTEIELPMADILTSEGSLYSGLLYYWVPEANSVSSITLRHVIRYYPFKKNVTQNAEIKDKEGDKDSKTEKEKKDSRKGKSVGVIANNGDLTVPFSRVETIHFWKIRKGSTVNIRLRHKDDIEKLKWYLLLVFTNKNFFKKVIMEIALDKETDAWFKEDLRDWVAKTKIKLPEGLVEVRRLPPQN